MLLQIMSPQCVNSPKIKTANDTKRNPVIFLYLIKFRSSLRFYWQSYQGSVYLHLRRGEKICIGYVGGRFFLPFLTFIFFGG